MNSTPVYYVDAPAGAGKTRTAVAWCVDQMMASQGDAWPRRILYAVPTIELARQVMGEMDRLCRCRRLAVPRRQIHSGAVQAPIQSLSERLAEAQTGIVVTTHRSALSVDPSGLAGWDVVFDETPAAIDVMPLSLADNHHLLTEHLALSGTERYASLEVKGRQQLRRYRDNPLDDDVNALFANLADLLLNPNYHCYLDRHQGERLFANVTSADLAVLPEGKLEPLAVLSPSGLLVARSLTFLSADMATSLLWLVWSAQGVVLTPHPMQSRIAMSGHDGTGVSFVYAVEGNWSRYRRQNHVCVDGRSLWDGLVEAVRDELALLPFFWASNVQDQEDLHRRFTGLGAVMLPNMPHGLNQFRHYHAAACLGAYNPCPAELGLLGQLGVRADDVIIARHNQTVYQQVLRSSLRCRDVRHERKIVVPDADVANWLAERFPGAVVRPARLAVTVGRKKPGPQISGTALSSTERSRRHRARKATSRAA